jgi:apolipoprotein N-acyltransferase
LLGALAAAGRPGIDLAPVFFASLIAFLCLVRLAPSLLQRLAVTTTWGIGLSFAISFGAQSWGLIVPLILTALGIVLYALPLALWACYGPKLFGPKTLFVAGAAAWSLWMDAGDRLGFPFKESALSLVTVAPALLGGARIVGANLVCGMLNAVSFGVAVALTDGARSRGARAAAALSTLVVGFGALLGLAVLAQASAPESARSVRVGVPQINADAGYYSSRLSPRVAQRFDETFEALMTSLADTELVVMTEGFDGRFGLMLPSVREKWQRHARERNQALLFASYTVEPNGWKGNAIAGIDSQGRVVGVHRKVDLAFRGEKPLAAGRHYQVLPVRPDLVVGAPICQESILPGAPHAMTRAGAQLLAVSTSDVTFGSSITAFEHLAMTQIRAIETGRSTVWASNGGPSGLIDRFGEFTPAGPFRGVAAVRVSAPLHDELTFFLRHDRLLLAGTVLVLAGLLLFGRRPRTDGPPAVFSAAPFLFTPPRAPVRAWVLTLACVLGTLSIWFAAPGAVELSRGDPSRAAGAISDAFTEPKIAAIPPSRFSAKPGQSALGAIAYFLTYYGIESSTAELPPGLPDNPSLEDVQAYLSAHFDVRTRRIPVTSEALPRVATLVRFRDGTYGVLSDWTGEGWSELLSPVHGRSTPARIEERTERVGLIPAVKSSENESGP